MLVCCLRLDVLYCFVCCWWSWLCRIVFSLLLYFGLRLDVCDWYCCLFAIVFDCCVILELVVGC